jgi:hypothetical protein
LLDGARGGLVVLEATFATHLLYSGERGEVFICDTPDNEPTAFGFASKPFFGHPPEWKCVLRCNGEPQRSIWINIVIGRLHDRLLNAVAKKRS